jgi:hypothetical protein
VRNEFAREWRRIENIEMWVNVQQTNRLLKPETFDGSVRPFSDVPNTSELLKNHVGISVRSAIYRPGAMQGVFHVKDKGLCINIFRPSTIVPIKGDSDLFDEFMAHLIPDEGDRKLAWRWCATLIAKPELRMLYALLRCWQEHVRVDTRASGGYVEYFVPRRE